MSSKIEEINLTNNLKKARVSLLSTRLRQRHTLLNLYMDLPFEERTKLFAGTATVADKIGITQRTLQYWIDSGCIKAVRIGQPAQEHFRQEKSCSAPFNNGKETKCQASESIHLS